MAWSSTLRLTFSRMKPKARLVVGSAAGRLMLEVMGLILVARAAASR